MWSGTCLLCLLSRLSLCTYLWFQILRSLCCRLRREKVLGLVKAVLLEGVGHVEWIAPVQVRGILLLHPALLHILLHRAQALTASSLRAVARCSCCCLGLCRDARGRTWLGGVRSCGIYLLPRSRALVLGAHSNRGCSPLLCCSEIRALEPFWIVSCVRGIWVGNSRACIAAVGSVALLLAARYFGDNRAAPLYFTRIMGHQVWDHWALRACDRAAKRWNCSAIKISAALRPLSISGRFRIAHLVIDTTPLYAWLHSLLRCVWINLCLYCGTIVLQSAQQELLLRDWVLDCLSLDRWCPSLRVRALPLLIGLLFNALLWIFDISLHVANQWVVLV